MDILIKNDTSKITKLEIYSKIKHNIFFGKYILNHFKNLKKYRFDDFISNLKFQVSDLLIIYSDNLNEFVHFKRLKEILDNNNDDDLDLIESTYITNIDLFHKFSHNMNYPYLITNFRFIGLNYVDQRSKKDTKIKFQDLNIKRIDELQEFSEILRDVFGYLEEINCFLFKSFENIKEQHQKYFNKLFNFNSLYIVEDPDFLFLKFFITHYKSFKSLSVFTYNQRVEFNQIEMLLNNDFLWNNLQLREFNIEIKYSKENEEIVNKYLDFPGIMFIE